MSDGALGSSRDERGTVTAFVTIVTLAFLMGAGLVLDGGEMLAARRTATVRAEQAARAGAQALDTDALRHRHHRLDHSAATSAARRFLDQAGVAGTVSVSGERVVVSVRIPTRMRLLTLVGLRTVTVSGSGEARPVRGVRNGET